MSERTLDDLRVMQSLPLDVKISMTRERIRQWVHEFGEDGCYVSYSGGKDSTVLLHIIRNLCGYKDIPAVFVDVPTQYPELKEFAQSFDDNLVILKPKISFADVCQKYGFPMVSKEVSDAVENSRKYLSKILSSREENASKPIDEPMFRSAHGIADLLGIERRKSKDGAYQQLLMGNIPDEFLANAPVRVQGLFGKVLHAEHGVKTNEYSRMYDKSKYRFFLDAPFEISYQCCTAMKKAPVKKYHRDTGRCAITGQMADESKLRQSQWVKNGCNGFSLKLPTSNPIAFWKENDVLQYIYENKIPICSIYGEVVEDFGDQFDGQMSLGDFGFYQQEKKFKCTGCQRSGCVLCCFGAQCERKEESRFLKLKQTHPKMYALLDVFKNNGVTFREAIEWYNERVGNRGKIWI